MEIHELYYLRCILDFLLLRPQLHSYDDYRECFAKCRSHFQVIEETFSSNVPTYVKTGDVAQPSFYGQEDAGASSSQGAASSSAENPADAVDEVFIICVKSLNGIYDKIINPAKMLDQNYWG